MIDSKPQGSRRPALGRGLGALIPGGSPAERKGMISLGIEEIRPEDFYRSSHRGIYDALVHLYSRGEPVDQVTAMEELKRRGTLEDIGGPLYIHELVEQVPTPAAARHYARPNRRTRCWHFK